MKIAVLLSGCGVYDGAEIQESVLTLLALDKLGAEVICTAPDRPQHHVVNHLDGSEQAETRNILVESARIARGEIKPLSELDLAEIDAVVMPGGFGVAKNFSQWAFQGPDGEVAEDIKRFIVEIVQAKKPLAALCISPTVVAKALQDSGISISLTVGTTAAKSPYDIQNISYGLLATGAQSVMSTVDEIVMDKTHRIISSPCYMMSASISQVQQGIEKACQALVDLVRAA